MWPRWGVFWFALHLLEVHAERGQKEKAKALAALSIAGDGTVSGVRSKRGVAAKPRHDEVQLNAGSSIPKACNDVADALPNVNFSDPQVHLVMGTNNSCGIFLPKGERCESYDCLWACGSVSDVSAEHPSCECAMTFNCHGIATALQPIKELPELICRPDTGSDTCTCYGFDVCPVDKPVEGWNCKLDKNIVTLPGRRAKVEPDVEKKILEQGTCECSRDRGSLREVTLSVDRDEMNVLRQHPLDVLVSPEAKTAADFTVVTKHKDGDNRVVIDIQKKDQKKKADKTTDGGTEQPAVAALTPEQNVEEKDKGSDSEPLVEHCVVTDGWPHLDLNHFWILLMLVSPLWIVTLILIALRATSGSRRSSNSSLRSRPEQRGDEVVGGDGQAGPGYRGQPTQRKRRDSQVSAVVAADPATQTGVRPPAGAYYCIVACVTLTKVNLTVVMNSSHLLVAQGHNGHSTSEAGNELGGAVSGLLIAAAPVGGCIGLFIIALFCMPYPREVFRYSCLMVAISSFGFLVAVQLNSLVMMLTLRFLSGFADGSLLMGQIYLSRLSSVDVRTEVFAFVEFGVAMGLTLGPVITSVFEFRASVGVVALLALLLFFLTVAVFPTNEEMGSLALAEDEERNPCWMVDEDMDVRKWIAGMVSWASAAARVVLRLAWESSAVMVLSAHYCLGYQITGYLIAAVVLMYLCSQSVFVTICGKHSDHRLIRTCEMIQIAGLLAMLRWPTNLENAEEQDVTSPTSVASKVAFFILGSGCLYSGNCLLAAPMNAWSTKQGPRKNCVLLYNNIAVEVGAAVGAYFARFYSGWDPHPNTVFILLMPMVISHFILAETGFNTMEVVQEASGCSGNSGADT